MKKPSLPLLFSLLASLLLTQPLRPGGGALARPRAPLALAGHEQPVALLHAGPATLVVTAHSVWRLEGRRLVRRYVSEAPVQCATATDTTLWLGTRHGVMVLGTRHFRARPLPLPTAEPAGSITAVFHDARGALWVGADGQGAFRQQPDGQLVQELRTPAVSAGAATADSSVWLATNIGLSRKQDTGWTRYNEEGVANHEIPDNIVNKLLLDNTGSLWVIMSDAIAVVDAAGRRAEGELPSVKFLGQPGNEVSGVVHLPGEGRLFATAQGLLLLPAEPAASFAPTASTDEIVPKQLLQPVAAPAGRPVLAQLDARQRLWLVSDEAVSILTPRQVRQLLHPAPAARR